MNTAVPSVSARAALQLLQHSRTSAAAARHRLTTGLKVERPADGVRSWSSALGLRSKAEYFGYLQDRFDATTALIVSAQAQLGPVQKVLGEIGAQLTAAQAPGADLAAVQSSLDTLRDRLRMLSSGAVHLGNNLLRTDSDASGYASREFWPFSDVGGSTPEIAPVGIDRSQIALYDSGSAASGLLQRGLDLSGLNGLIDPAPSLDFLSGVPSETTPNSGVGPSLAGLGGTASAAAGLDAVVPSTAGLSGTPSVSGAIDRQPPSTAGLSGSASAVAGAAATPATAVVGTANGLGYLSGDTAQMQTTYNGVSRTLNVYMRNVSSAATLQSELQRALDTAYGNGQLTARVAADNTISISSVSTGAAQSLSVTGVTMLDGDDKTTSTLNLSTQYSWNSSPNATIGGRGVTAQISRSPDLSQIDQSDRLQLRIAGRDASNRIELVDVTVLLTGVTNEASLASAINGAIASAGYGGSYGAGLEDGTNHVLVYTKVANGDIAVISVAASNGNGVVAANPGFATGSATGNAAVAASVTTGSGFGGPITIEDGAAIGFNLLIDGSATAIRIDRDTVDDALAGRGGYTPGSGVIASTAAYALVVQQALSDANVRNVSVVASGNRLVFTKTGWNATSGTLGLGGVTATATDVAASVTTGSNFSGPITIAPNAELDFDVTVDGATTRVALTHDLVQSVLGTDGVISSAGRLAQVVNAGLVAAGVTGVTAAASGQRITLTRTVAGTGSVGFGNVSTNAVATRAVTTAGSAFSGPMTIEDGASLTFDLGLDGGAAKAVTIDKSVIDAALAGRSGYVAGSGRIADAASYAAVVQEALAQAGIAGVTVGQSGGRLTFTRDAAGAGSIALTNVTAHAGAASRVFLTGADFTAPIAVEGHATIAFDVAANGGATKHVVIDEATVDAALAGEDGYVAGSGRIETAAQLAKVFDRALADAGVTGVSTAYRGKRLAIVVAGGGTPAVSNLSSGTIRFTGSDLSLDQIDLTGTFFTDLDGGERNLFLDALSAGVRQRLADVMTAGRLLTAAQARIDDQTDFLAGLQAMLSGAADRLTMADLNAEQARVTALQAKQQLALNALQILNATNANVLKLFEPSVVTPKDAAGPSNGTEPD
ncbi:flagellin N-terminal helical domain-containing protein [Mangrovibrevibacter kandeliae]|uniref:flagellin N-terminal helical domain-containing protein n=1 Tax=Mangrovibrevibacter kandeliae TaxID=2968473 RepID=UPI0021182845|nr:flagellin [Aurantimonas sp. CSK15Z-1]MCQ8780585.1 flagellin [Aurantimonas sp. CSK15Z-1]